MSDGGAPQRRAQLELQLGRMLHRHGESTQAAAHLERALTDDPDSEEARETLAEIYASPGAVLADGQTAHRRAGALFVDLGQIRLLEGDTDGAIVFLRRALGVDAFSQPAIEALERALPATGGWDELDRLYRQALTSAQDDDERRALLRKRADLAEHRLEDREELKRCLEQLAALEPPGNEHCDRLRELYTEDEDWQLLSSLLETQIDLLEQAPSPDDPTETGGLAPGPARLVRELLDLATLTRERLGDRDRAAELLHRALTIDPRNDEALTRYADHFRERRDWRGLADLNEFAIENLREAGAPPADLVRRLEELAHLAELRLGDIDRAITTWRRVEELDPHNPRAVESLRRLLSRAKMWESLVGMLEQEAEAAATPEARAEALRRIAQVYRDRQVNPRRAIQLYEEIVSLLSRDEPALKALAELYEREGDDTGLAGTIRRQLDIDAEKVTAELERDGKRVASAREWPVARRVERLTALRRLAGMYEQRLADVDGVVFACTGVLEILPGDRDALERMERVLDKAGDAVRLEQTLEYHASSATGPAEKAKVLRRMARLAQERGDEVTAMDRWEHVLKAVPSDVDALAQVADLYERHSRWGELAVVLERSLMTQKRPEPGSAAAAKRAAELKRYARVVDDKMGDAPRATRAWRKLLEILGRDRDALDALARLHEQQGQWRELAEILEKQAPVYREEDPHKAAEVALRRARLLEERLGAPAEATRALEELIRELNPAHMTAHQSLRRLYEARGDFEAAVRVAERELYLTEEPQRKIARGLEIGLLCRDRLGDGNRALAAFERVLALAPDQEEALGAAAELYGQTGDWTRHVQALERRIGSARDSRDVRALMQRIAQATAERLGDHRAAFSWYRRAHEQVPDATTMADLRRAAEAYGLWRELAAVYEDERARLAPSPTDLPTGDLASSYVATCRELATLAERRLGDPRRALDAVRDALRVHPDSEELLVEAERIATEAGQADLWARVLECLDSPLAAADRAGRVELLARRARMREERMDDAAGAAHELLTAFSWAPDREDLQQSIEALSERSGEWSDMLAVLAALFERAPTLEARVQCLRRNATILEDKVGSRVRAFRAHLAAFLLAPEDGDTVAHLWRLAREIGRYEEADRTAQPEPPAAHVEPLEPPRRRPRRTAELRIEATTPARSDATQELTMEDLVAADVLPHQIEFDPARAQRPHHAARDGRPARDPPRLRDGGRSDHGAAPRGPDRGAGRALVAASSAAARRPRRPRQGSAAASSARAADQAPGRPARPHGHADRQHLAPLALASRRGHHHPGGAAARLRVAVGGAGHRVRDPAGARSGHQAALAVPRRRGVGDRRRRDRPRLRRPGPRRGRGARGRRGARPPAPPGRRSRRVGPAGRSVRGGRRGSRHRAARCRSADGGGRDPLAAGAHARHRAALPPRPGHAARRSGGARAARGALPRRRAVGRPGRVARGADRSAPGRHRAAGRAARAPARAFRPVRRQAVAPARRHRRAVAPAPAGRRRRRGARPAGRAVRPDRALEQGHRGAAQDRRGGRGHPDRARCAAPHRPHLPGRAGAARPRHRRLRPACRPVAQRRAGLRRPRWPLRGARALEAARRGAEPARRAHRRPERAGGAAAPARPRAARLAAGAGGGGLGSAPGPHHPARRRRAGRRAGQRAGCRRPRPRGGRAARGAHRGAARLERQRRRRGRAAHPPGHPALRRAARRRRRAPGAVGGHPPGPGPPDRAQEHGPPGHGAEGPAHLRRGAHARGGRAGRRGRQGRGAHGRRRHPARSVQRRGRRARRVREGARAAPLSGRGDLGAGRAGRAVRRSRQGDEGAGGAPGERVARAARAGPGADPAGRAVAPGRGRRRRREAARRGAVGAARSPAGGAGPRRPARPGKALEPAHRLHRGGDAAPGRQAAGDPGRAPAPQGGRLRGAGGVRRGLRDAHRGGQAPPRQSPGQAGPGQQPLPRAPLARGGASPERSGRASDGRGLSHRGGRGPLSRGAGRDPLDAPGEGRGAVRARGRAQAELRPAAPRPGRDGDGEGGHAPGRGFC